MKRTDSPWPVEVAVHRGGSALPPENMLGAVNLDWQLNVDAVEVAVHLSADCQLVVIHDETLERTAGRSERVDSAFARDPCFSAGWPAYFC